MDIVEPTAKLQGPRTTHVELALDERNAQLVGGREGEEGFRYHGGGLAFSFVHNRVARILFPSRRHDHDVLRKLTPS